MKRLRLFVLLCISLFPVLSFGASPDREPEKLEVIVSGGRCGLINADGELVHPVIYERMEFWNDRFFRARLNGQHGLIDQVSGEEIVTPGKYDTIRPLQFQRAIVKKDGLLGLIDGSGNELVPPTNFHDIKLLYGCYIFEDASGRMGIISPQGEVLYTGKGDYIYWSELKWPDKTHYSFLLAQGICRMTDVATGKNIAVFPADSIGILTKDGLAAFRRDRKMGFVDVSGHEVLPPKYPWAGGFYGGLCAVSGKLKNNKPGKVGFMDKSGKLVIPMVYEDAMPFPSTEKGQYTAVKKGGKWGIIDKKGNLEFAFEYNRVEQMTNAYIFLSKGGKTSVFNLETGRYIGDNLTLNDVYFMTAGKQITPAEEIAKEGYRIAHYSDGQHIMTRPDQTFVAGTGYDDIRRAYNRTRYPEDWPLLFFAEKKQKKDSRFYLIRLDETVVAGPFDKITDCQAPDPLKLVWKVKKGDQEGIIDRQGRYVLPLGDYSLSRVSENRFIVRNLDNSRCRLADIYGKTIYSMGNYRIFSHGASSLRVETKDGEFLIDLDGKVLGTRRWDSILSQTEGHSVVKANNHWGAIDEKGNVIIEPVYYRLSSMRNNVFLAKKDRENNQIYILSRTGKELGSYPSNRANYYMDANDFHHGMMKKENADSSIYLINKFGETVYTFPEGLRPYSTLCEGGYIYVTDTPDDAPGWKKKTLGVMDGLGNYIVPLGKHTISSSVFPFPLSNEYTLYMEYFSGWYIPAEAVENKKDILYDIDGHPLDESNKGLSGKAFSLDFD